MAVIGHRKTYTSSMRRQRSY